MKSLKAKGLRGKSRGGALSTPKQQEATKSYDYILDRLNEVALGAYALTTAEIWSSLYKMGTITPPDGALLAMATLLQQIGRASCRETV